MIATEMADHLTGILFDRCFLIVFIIHYHIFWLQCHELNLNDLCESLSQCSECEEMNP